MPPYSGQKTEVAVLQNVGTCTEDRSMNTFMTAALQLVFLRRSNQGTFNWNWIDKKLVNSSAGKHFVNGYF
jgi:hypothetical protein